MLVIHDESLAERLRALARRQNRPVESVLAELLDQYPESTAQSSASARSAERPLSEGARRARRKAYAKARQYWMKMGDAAKAALTDDELDAQFGAFDEQGIPRLKHELDSPEPPPGSLAYAARIAAAAGLRSGRPDLARRSDALIGPG